MIVPRNEARTAQEFKPGNYLSWRVNMLQTESLLQQYAAYYSICGMQTTALKKKMKPCGSGYDNVNDIDNADDDNEDGGENDEQTNKTKESSNNLSISRLNVMAPYCVTSGKIGRTGITTIESGRSYNCKKFLQFHKTL